MESFIVLDRNGEFDDRRVGIDRGEGCGIGLAREEGGPANLRLGGGGAALLHLSQQETVAGAIVAERTVRRAPLVRVVAAALRSEERRVGKESVSTCRSRGSA